MEQTSNLKLPLINVNNAEDLKITFINFVKMICGVDDSSALQILDNTIKNLQNTKQDTLTAGENITITNNVISGVGGVEEEDVMDIIENNAEQTDTLEVENATEIAIGTSETFNPESDEQIPTSKAVSDLMASAGGGSSGGSKLYRHNFKFFNSMVNLITNDSTPFTQETFKNYLYNNGYITETSGLIILCDDGLVLSYIVYATEPYSTDNTQIQTVYPTLQLDTSADTPKLKITRYNSRYEKVKGIDTVTEL